MQKAIKKLFWITIGTLIVIGFLYLSSASMVIGSSRFGDPFFFVKDQFFKGLVVGLIAFLVVYLMDLKILRKFSFLFLLINIVLLFLTKIEMFMMENATADRWVKIGGFAFQPSEFLKVTLIIFGANFLSKKSVWALNSWVKTIAPFWLIAMVPLTIVFLQPSTSMVFLLLIALATMFFSTKISFKNILIIIGIGIIALILGIALIYSKSDSSKSNYRMKRLETFLKQNTDASYHLDQAKTGIVRGGLFGLGFGKSIQKHSYLPESHTDSIYPVIAEEFGFVFGTSVILLLYFLVCFLGLYIAFHSKNSFNALFAIGTVTWVTIQAIMHIACMSGLVPLTGLPLPFISYGGTDYVATMVSMGILYNIINKG